MKKVVLKNFTSFTPSGLQLDEKETPAQMFSCEYLEIFKSTYLEVQTLVNEIYSCFLMSEVIPSLLGKVKKIPETPLQ